MIQTTKCNQEDKVWLIVVEFYFIIFLVVLVLSAHASIPLSSALS